jgi:hypothetical protein
MAEGQDVSAACELAATSGWLISRVLNLCVEVFMLMVAGT